jgi:hypothetical protein
MHIISLKNNVRTKDPRLDRVQQFDERSRGYPIRATIDPSVEPRSYTWRCNTWIDQGAEGSCVGHACAHEIAARPKVLGADSALARHIYHEAQKIDPWPGGSYPGASPRYEGTSILAGVKMLRSMGYIQEYRWAFGLEDLVLAVGYKGPAILGLNWYEGMFEPWSCGHLHVQGGLAGGHAILCKGVSVTHRTFTLHNSWGNGWGNGGDALISWDEMNRLLHEQGESVIPLRRSVPV